MDCSGYFKTKFFLKTNATIFAGVGAAFIAAIAWLFKTLATSLAWHYRRSLREYELAIAVQAEIKNNIVSEKIYADKESSEKYKDKMLLYKEKNIAFLPYVTLYKEDMVIDSIKNELSSLPSKPLPSIVRYYNNSNGLTAQLEDFRSDFFKNIGASRQIAVWADVQKLAEETVKSGNMAVSEIQYYIEKRRRNFVLSYIAAAVVLVMAAISGSRAVDQAKIAFNEAARLVSTCGSPPVTDKQMAF